jgi:hypothetical protein
MRARGHGCHVHALFLLRHKSMQWSEYRLCQILVGYLRQRGIKHFHVPNEGKRNAQHAAKLRALGLEPGVPDYFIMAPSPVLITGAGVHAISDSLPRKTNAVEVKATGKKPTAAQYEWLATCRDADNGAYWVQGPQGIVSALRSYGISITL